MVASSFCWREGEKVEKGKRRKEGEKKRVEREGEGKKKEIQWAQELTRIYSFCVCPRIILKIIGSIKEKITGIDTVNKNNKHTHTKKKKKMKALPLIINLHFINFLKSLFPKTFKSFKQTLISSVVSGWFKNTFCKNN